MLVVKASLRGGAGAGEDVGGAFETAVDEGRLEAGRLGHGLGMQLTEWPSIIPQDQTPLAPGMVLTLEPSVTLPSGKIMVHEENIVIRGGGAEFLSAVQDPNIRVI